MYNRYIPGLDGRYQALHVPEPHSPEPPEASDGCCPPEPPCREDCAPPEPPCPPPSERCCSPALRRFLPGQLDTGDLLILLILLLLLVDGDEGDTLGVLLTAAAFLLL